MVGRAGRDPRDGRMRDDQLFSWIGPGTHQGARRTATRGHIGIYALVGPPGTVNYCLNTQGLMSGNCLPTLSATAFASLKLAACRITKRCHCLPFTVTCRSSEG